MSLYSKKSLKKVDYREKTDYEPHHRIFYRSGKWKTQKRLTRERVMVATRPAREALILAKKRFQDGV